ncbi:MAG: hypothetical protein HC833_19140 [Leptolyngbyaceae cyanobacterium RM1_406_9]|nr:hypothetical protein [Leptolyngbyaceae cyanobacterium RM1_406_9]
MRIWHWALLGMSFVMNWGAIAPAVLAEARQLDYTLSSQGSRSYAVLVQQAEQMADRLVRQSFSDAAVTQVSLRILGEHNGSEAPVLYLTVSRTDWQANPDIQTQARYFGRPSAVLLGFTQPQAIQTAAALPIGYPTSQDVENSLSDTEPNFYD